jgi:hypothetical protein
MPYRGHGGAGQLWGAQALVVCENHKRVATLAVVNVCGYDNARQRGGGSANRRCVGEPTAMAAERRDAGMVGGLLFFWIF